MTIIILSGGTGTPKLLNGFNKKKDEFSEKIVVIANTGDDWDFYGLYVSPDVDAVLYLLSGLLDTEKFWGIKDDSFNAIGSLKKLQEDIWFNLGDKDMGICLYRTNLMANDLSLVEVTDKIRKRLGIDFEVYPMSNDSIQTYFNTKKGRFHLEEFFIKHKNKFEIESVEYVGATTAKVPEEIIKLLKSCNMVIIGPSNPISSIGPILYPNFKKELKKINAPIVVISPIIGNKAISGPTKQYLLSLGFESTPEGIIKFYQDIADTFIFHESDENYDLIKKYPEKNLFFENILFSKEEAVLDIVDTLLRMKREKD